MMCYRTCVRLEYTMTVTALVTCIEKHHTIPCGPHQSDMMLGYRSIIRTTTWVRYVVA